MLDAGEALTFAFKTDGATGDQASGRRLVCDVMSDRYVIASPHDTVQSVVTAISEKRALCAAIVHDETLVGVLTQDEILRDLSRGTHLEHLTVNHCLAGEPITVGPQSPVVNLAELMETKGIACVCVIDSGRLVGVVTHKHVTRALLSLHPLKCAADIVKDTVVTVDTGSTVAEVSDIMISKNTSCVIALHQGVPAGIVTSKDLLRRVAALRRDPMTTQVVEIMSFPLISIPPTCSILSTAAKMDALSLHSLVVMAGDTIHGIVTQFDALRALRSEIDWIRQTRLPG